jgi:hypothetical protein
MSPLRVKWAGPKLQTYHYKNWNLNGHFAKTSDDSTNSHGTNFDKHFSNEYQELITSNYLNIFANFTCIIHA